MTDEQKEKCRQIVEHYGFEGQRDILIEECAELIQAVCKIKRDGGGVSFNFLEELADVSIMIEQMKQAFADDELIDYLCFINRKIERQMCRMNGTHCVFVETCSKQAGDKGFCGEWVPKRGKGE